MKKIYTVTLDDDVPLSEEVKDSIKVLCYLVYDEIKIKGLDTDDNDIILCHDDIDYNELLENDTGNKIKYRFKYEDYTSGKYEPFMINNISFGFTVNNNMITDEEIIEIIEKVKRMIKIDYNFTIKYTEYDDDKKHKNRLIALKNILLNDKDERKENRYIKIMKPLFSSFIIR